jgi:predicted transposase/invertase (TIGR01784 family)
MLQVTDITQTRVYQEALEQGRREGMEKGMEKGIEVVARRLIEIGRPLAEIARATGLSVAQVRTLSKKSRA